MTDLVTVDLGNSRCKLARWDGASCVAALTLPAPSQRNAELPFAAALAEWLGSSGAACALSSVAATEVEEAVRAALEDRLGPGAVIRPDHALAIDSPAPDGVGLDRLFAARGAIEHVRASVVVVDAGTALTVDAVRCDDPAASGGLARATFLGGAIAPGPALLAAALAAGAARLPRVAPAPDAHALGRTTEEAIRAGVGVGFRGAALELVRGVAAEAGLVGARILVTGGAAEFVLGGGGLAELGAERVDELVHLGLLHAWKARGADRRA